MTVLRCTHRLLTEIGAPPTDVREFAGQGILGSWHADIFRIKRRKAVIFTNDKTLYSFVVAGLHKKDTADIGELFRDGLFSALKSMGIDAGRLQEAMDETARVITGKTNSRSILGTMNDHIATTIFHTARDGGLEGPAMADINKRLNDRPMKGIGYSFSEERIRKLLGAAEPP